VKTLSEVPRVPRGRDMNANDSQGYETATLDYLVSDESYDVEIHGPLTWISDENEEDSSEEE